MQILIIVDPVHTPHLTYGPNTYVSLTLIFESRIHDCNLTCGTILIVLITLMLDLLQKDLKCKG